MCSASQPSLLPEPARQAQRHALLAEQRVAAVSRSDRPDGVVFGEVHDEAALGVEVAERVQAVREVVRIAQMVERDLADARHDAHAQDDVLAVGDLDADLRELRARRPHQERDDVERASLHGAREERRQLRARVARCHPVVVRSRVLLRARADEREMFGAGDVVRCAPVEVAAGKLLLVQLDQLAGGERFLNQLLLFRVGAVAVDDAVGGGECA